MKKITVAFGLIILTLLLSTKTVQAADDSLGRIVQDSLYGGTIGTLVGTASLAFVDKASDHTSNIAKGAAVGIFLGAIYGTMKVTGVLAEVKDGKIFVGVPTLQPLADTSGHVFWQANLFRASF